MITFRVTAPVLNLAGHELASPLDTPVLRYTECSEEETLAAKREGKNIPRNMYKTRLLLGTRILLQ